MSYRYQTQVSLSFGLGFLLLLTSCGESKTSQCNKLIAEINKGQTTYEKSASAMGSMGNVNPTKPEEVKAQIAKVQESLGKFVQDIRKVGEQIKEVNLADPKLKELQSKYISQLETIATGFDDSSKAFATLGTVNFTAPEALKQIEASTKQVGENIQKAGKAGQESNLTVGEINTYCTGK